MTTTALTDEDLVREVEAIIREVSGDSQAPVWSEPRENGRVGFVTVSPGFADMTQVERQERLWEVLEARLGTDAHRIDGVYVRTPEEVK